MGNTQKNADDFRRWKKLQKEVQLSAAAYDYYNMMLENVEPMIEYDDLPAHGVEMGTLIEYAAACGVAGVCYFDGVHHCGLLHWSDVPDDNGIAKTCIISGSHWSKEFRTDEIAYFRFTHSQSPANHLRWFGRMFAQVDDSQRCLVRNTKYTPIPIVSTENEAAKYEDALRRQQNGEDITVIVNPLSNPLFSKQTQQRENDKILSLGDAAMIEKMHFLSEYHAELKKRFGAIYGMCFKSSAKSAQESLDEIHGMDNFSLIVPYNMRAEMQLFADKCAKLWSWAGRDAVRFGELWRREDEQADTETARESEKGGGENAESVEGVQFEEVQTV